MKIGVSDSSDYPNARIEHTCNWVDNLSGLEDVAYYGMNEADAITRFELLKEESNDIRRTIALISNDEDNDVIDEEILDSYFKED